MNVLSMTSCRSLNVAFRTQRSALLGCQQPFIRARLRHSGIPMMSRLAFSRPANDNWTPSPKAVARAAVLNLMLLGGGFFLGIFAETYRRVASGSLAAFDKEAMEEMESRFRNVLQTVQEMHRYDCEHYHALDFGDPIEVALYYIKLMGPFLEACRQLTDMENRFVPSPLVLLYAMSQGQLGDSRCMDERAGEGICSAVLHIHTLLLSDLPASSDKAPRDEDRELVKMIIEIERRLTDVIRDTLVLHEVWERRGIIRDSAREEEEETQDRSSNLVVG